MTDVLAFLILLILLRRLWRDDTDQRGWCKKVSGLMLYTDYGTGLQYLGNPLGGITPRMDADGKHMRVEAGHD